MKPSGIEWLRDIPAHWDIKRNKTLFSLFSGYAFKSNYFSKSSENAPILVTPGNFNPEGGLYFTEENTIYYLGDYSSDFVLKSGDQIVVMTDLSYKKLILGQCVTVNKDGLLLNQRLAKISIYRKLQNHIEAKYIQYILNAICVREQVISTARGSTVFHSSPNKIYDCWIPLPPLLEQKNIVLFLERGLHKVNQAIAQAEKEIELIQEYRTTLISDAVTGKIDIRDTLERGAAPVAVGV